MLTTSEAAKRLGITPRHFGRLRKRYGAIEGSQLVEGAWAFPLESVDRLAERMADKPEESDDEEDTVEDAAAAAIREAGRALKELIEVVTKGFKFTLDADERLVNLSFTHAENAGKALHQAQQHSLDQQKHSLDAVTLVKELIVDQGKLEADQIKAQADQTIRVERTKLAASGIRQLAPVAKAGLARWAGMPGLARDAQADAIKEIVRTLKDNPEKMMKLQETFTEKQREAVGVILGFAEGSEHLQQAFSALKEDITEDQIQTLGTILDDKQMMAIGDLFEGEEKKKSA